MCARFDAPAQVVVHGPMFSTATTKVRTALVFAKISHKHETHMVVKGKENQGMKPGTPYQKCPVMDASGRQVRRTAWILVALAVESASSSVRSPAR